MTATAALLLLLACRGETSDSAGSTSTADAATGDTDAPETEPEPSDSEPSDPVDTAATDLVFEGEATVVPGASWTGTESRAAIGVPNQVTLCSWTWTATDWATARPGEPDPVTTPCADPDGNPCALWATVVLDDGEATVGDCAPYWGSPATDDGAWAGYGYTDHFLAYGEDYGRSLLLFSPAYGTWSPVDPYATFDPATGALAYRLVAGHGIYAP